LDFGGVTGEFLEAIHEENGRYRIEFWAAAWLFYGPPLDATLTSHQWAEIATCRFIYSEQQEWLQRRYSPACAGAVLDICCRDARVGTWSDVVRVHSG